LRRFTGGKNTTADGTRYLPRIFPPRSRRKFRLGRGTEIIATATERQLRLLGKHSESNYG